MQLPFALAGTLPEGELLVHDAESGEALVLWSDPPRRVAGLGPFFAHHDLQVNDSVVMEIDGDEIHLTATKRPRRSRPVVQPSTWTSVREVPAPPVDPEAADDARFHPPADLEVDPQTDPRAEGAAGRSEDTSPAASVPSPFRTPPGPSSEPTPPTATHAAADDLASRPVDASPAPDPSDRSGTWADGPLGDLVDDADDAPRAPAVTVRPAEGGATRGSRPLPSSAAMPRRGGAFSGLRRWARSLFGASSATPRDADRSPSKQAPDWTQGWGQEEEEDDATPGFAAEGRDERPIEHTVPKNDPGRGTPHVAALNETRRKTTDESHDEWHDEPHDAAHGGSLGRPQDGRQGSLHEDVREDLPEDLPEDVPDDEQDVGHDDRLHAGRAGAEPETGFDEQVDEDVDEDVDERLDDAFEATPDANSVAPTPLFPEPMRPRGPVRRPVDETPSGVPARAERFLGGDLRTRLLRYLASPEMGSIAHADRIAKRFDLDEATAAELLADIADDPPEGLRLREVRQGGWRIERTLGR